MDYKTVSVNERPTKAPDQFCVFDYEGENYIFCPIRKRLYRAKPEEIVRQWWIYRLKEVYGYSFPKLRLK